jgi:hypothetical protein
MSQSNKNKSILSEVKKQECLEDYLSYVDTERNLLKSTQLEALNPALFRRILRCFGSWRTFINLATPYIDAVRRH